MDLSLPEEILDGIDADPLEAPLAELASRASEIDDAGGIPQSLMQALREAALFAAPLPLALGGLGIGTDPGRAAETFGLLRRIGRASLPLGRIFEGHLNAIRLVLLYGTPFQADQIAADARAGHIFGLWVTDSPRDPVRREAGVLSGTKSPASGADHATRALILLTDDMIGERMAVIEIHPARSARAAKLRLQGMRAAGTSSIPLDGVAVPDDALIGTAGDYMRQPEISLGAWRTLAVIMGGLDALVQAARLDLAKRGRHTEPHQLARMGQVAIAHETAALWLEKAAALAEKATPDDEAAENYVKLARIAVETAALDVIRHVQRAVGMSALVAPHPVERLSRDLGTYLRQPALDMVLDEAALYYAERPIL